MNDYLILVPVGYVLGSLPFGLIAGWAFRRIDVRDFGSGKTGVSNVLRTVGRPAALLVLLLDMGKAILAVVLASVLSDSHGVEAAAALAALVGHSWPAFVGFKGGRGSASGWGLLLILSPLSGLVAAAVGIPVLGLTRYISLGSLLAAIAGTGTLVILSATGHAPWSYIWFGIGGGGLVVVQHRDNIRRLLRGEERKLGEAENTQHQPRTDRRRGLPWSRSA